MRLLGGGSLEQGLRELRKDDAIVWHISDLHFGNSYSFFGFFDYAAIQTGIRWCWKKIPYLKKVVEKCHLFFNPGHCISSLEVFQDLLKARTTKDEDMFIITGDLTKRGSSKEIESYLEFRKRLSLVTDKIYEIPGNHDYWGGKPFIGTALVGLASKIQPIWHLFSFKCLGLNNSLSRFYERNLLRVFEKNPFSIEEVSFRGLNVLLVLVDSNYRDKNAVAQGRFPLKEFEDKVKHYLNSSQHDVRIMAIHHHLVDYLHAKESNLDFILYEVGTRVTNSYEATRVIERLSFDYVLHGHKHQQDTKIFTGLHNYGVFLAAPATFLDGKEHSDDKIGFNIIVFEKRATYVLVVRLEEEKYVCLSVERFRRK